MKIVALIVLAAALAGCSTLETAGARNRVSCSVSGGDGFFISNWGFFGISTPIDPEDAAVVCKRK